MDVRFASTSCRRTGSSTRRAGRSRAACRHLGIEGVHDVRVGRRVELTVDADAMPTARAVVERLAGELLSQPADRGVRGRGLGAARRGGGPPMTQDRRRRLPGLELRSRRAPRRSSWPAPSRSRCGTRTPISTASDAVILPGGFAYGDYLRAGVIARFSPVMGAVAAFAADGGLVLGHLQRLPGPDRGRPAARRAAAQRGLRFARSLGRDRGRAPRHAVHPPSLARGRAVAHADRPRRGLLLRRRRRRSTRSSATARSLFRYVDARGRGRSPANRPIPTARCGRSRA